MKLSKYITLFFITLSFTCNVFAQEEDKVWEILFADEFNGTSVNEDDWAISTSGGFSKNSLEVSDGTLKIHNTFTTNKVSSGGWIESKKQYGGDERFGYYEARIRITENPDGKIWPTWWIWGKNWRRIDGVVNTESGTEFDLMEYSGFAKKFSNNFATSSHHYFDKQLVNGSRKTESENNDTRNAFEWHVWALYWTPTEISFYYDGERYMTSNEPQNAFDDPYPLSLIFSCSPHTVDVPGNNNNGGYQPNNDPLYAPQPGEVLPSFEIDYVRVWALGTKGGDNGCGDLPNDICSEGRVNNDNFRVSSKNVSCIGRNDGEINIEALKEFTYTAELVGKSSSKNFTKTTSFDNLTPGTYEVCITFDEEPSFRQCFDLIVKEPEQLNVSSTVAKDSKKIDLQLSGSEDFYQITLNGENYQTYNSNISLDLKSGVNTLEISASKECQGKYEQKVLIGNDFSVYPNPAKDVINFLILDNEIEKATIQVFDVSGSMVKIENSLIQDNTAQLNISKLKPGIYIATISGNTLFEKVRFVKN